MCFKGVSEIIIMTNLELHTFLKHAGCPRGEGLSNSDNDGEGRGEGVKNLTFCRTSFVNGPLVNTVLYNLRIGFSEKHKLEIGFLIFKSLA